ncbi:MAG TPA: energy transducer TonB [Verrucomicrobiota bacterium]|nr:energy transducer TonB [Verrucomicrobiota bacterium]
MDARRLLGNWQYPYDARRRLLQGRVVVDIVVGPGGRVVEAEVVQSSGHAILDKAARDMVLKARLSSEYIGQLRVPFDFQLAGVSP